MKKQKPYDYVKRVFDFIFALLLLVLTLPIQLIVALLVRIKLGSPVLFKQERPGKNTKIFKLLKFRTMLSIDEKAGLITNEQRLTDFGNVLRSSSIDELPSIINILIGDMSFVGPRPLRVSYLSRYSAEQNLRHTVKPGLTGLAQVNGRNGISWDDRLCWDLSYAQNYNFLMDLKILSSTIQTVFSRRNISEEGEATMSEFFGPERTSRLFLRDLSENDLAERVSLLSEPDIRSGISISFQPTLKKMNEWYANIQLDNSRWDWVVTEVESGETVAMLGLKRTSEVEASLYIFVDPKHQGKNYGKESMQLLLTKARQLQFSKITLETQKSNLRAINLYLSLGFAESLIKNNKNKIFMFKSLKLGH